VKVASAGLVFRGVLVHPGVSGRTTTGQNKGRHDVQ